MAPWCPGEPVAWDLEGACVVRGALLSEEETLKVKSPEPCSALLQLMVLLGLEPGAAEPQNGSLAEP